MSRALHALVLAALLVSGGCITSLPYIEGDLGFIAPQVGGSAKLDSSGGGGADLSIPSSLGLDERDVTPYVAVRGGMFGLNASLSGFSTSMSGSSVLPGSFGDLGAGTAVDTKFDMDDARATLTLSLINLGPVRLAAGAGLEYFGIDLEVRDQSGSQQEKIQAEGAVPMVVGEGELELGPFRTLASLGLSGGDWGDSHGSFIDGELTLRLSPFPFLELFAGYRYIELGAQASTSGKDFDLDMNLGGYLAGATLRF